MERKTKVNAEPGKQDILIVREFNLPIKMLFRAYSEPQIVEQWMGTKVLKLENRQHGGYQFETKGTDGNVLFRANGTIHEYIPNNRIVRTFDMENTPFDVQLEFLEFTELTEDTSRLNMHIIYRSVVLRDQHLQLPFAQGLNMAHNRLQEIAYKLK